MHRRASIFKIPIVALQAEVHVVGAYDDAREADSVATLKLFDSIYRMYAIIKV